MPIYRHFGFDPGRRRIEVDKTNHIGYMPRRDGSWGVSASPLRPGARSALSKDGGVRIRGTNGGACYPRRGIGPQARKVVRQEREPAPVPACPSGSSEFGPSTRHFRHSHKPASRTQTSADRTRPRLPHLPAALTGLATRPVTAQVVGNEADQATAKRPSTRSRIALSADWPERRAVPVTERYPAWI